MVFFFKVFVFGWWYNNSWDIIIDEKNKNNSNTTADIHHHIYIYISAAYKHDGSYFTLQLFLFYYLDDDSATRRMNMMMVNPENPKICFLACENRRSLLTSPEEFVGCCRCLSSIFSMVLLLLPGTVRLALRGVV